MVSCLIAFKSCIQRYRIFSETFNTDTLGWSLLILSHLPIPKMSKRLMLGARMDKMPKPQERAVSGASLAKSPTPLSPANRNGRKKETFLKLHLLSAAFQAVWLFWVLQPPPSAFGGSQLGIPDGWETAVKIYIHEHPYTCVSSGPVWYNGQSDEVGCGEPKFKSLLYQGTHLVNLIPVILSPLNLPHRVAVMQWGREVPCRPLWSPWKKGRIKIWESHKEDLTQYEPWANTGLTKPNQS